MQNPTKEMLHEIYTGARCGCEAITGMIPKITDSALLAETTAQLETYAGFTARAEKMMQDKQLGTPSFSLANKLSVRGGVMLETMGSRSQNELARILRVSSRDSANRMRSAVSDLSRHGCDPDALALGQKMMAYEIAEAEKLGAMQCK